MTNQEYYTQLIEFTKAAMQGFLSSEYYSNTRPEVIAQYALAAAMETLKVVRAAIDNDH